MKSKSRELKLLLNAVKHMELARLSHITNQQSELSRKMEHIRDDRSNMHIKTMKSDRLSPSSRCDAGTKWGLWVESELRSLSFDLANLAAKREQQKIRAQIALGQVAAFESLLQKRIALRPKR